MTEDAELQRLQKVLAAAGVASRRASEEFISAGRVTVDGEVAHLGMKIDPATAVVHVDGERVTVDPERVYVVLNKPTGFVTTVSDPDGRPTVMELVNLPGRLFPVGRLDKDTEGLLLLTNDGALAHGLMHPSFEVERTYLALVPGPVRKAQLAALREGVMLDDGPAVPKRVRIVEESRGKVLIELVMTEGRNREVRRILGHLGFKLERLARTEYAGVTMGDLRQGKWRFLTTAEVAALFTAVDSGGTPRRASKAPRKGGVSAPRQPGDKKRSKSTNRSAGKSTKRQVGRPDSGGGTKGKR